jgi:predicted nucleic acid-binding protein
LRDLLLSLASAGLFHARWSERIQDEWVRHLLLQRPDLKQEDLQRTCTLMSRAIPDSLVTGWEPIEQNISGLPDPDDRHVVAAALRGHADAVVTFNLKDFPAEVMDAMQIEVQHPDDFLLNQLDLAPIPALKAIKAMRARLRKPPIEATDLVTMLEKLQLPLSAARLREFSDLI